MKRNLLLFSVLFILCIFLQVSCNTIKPYYSKDYRDWESIEKSESEVTHTIYLIGDGGEINKDDPNRVLGLLKKNLMEEKDSTSSLIFLGDNIYQRGLPDESASNRGEKEEILKLQLDVTKGYKGKVIMIPGNHDWDYSGPDGLNAINREEKFVEEYLKENNQNAFLPDNGCPGPVEIQVNDRLTMIVVDTEWWLRSLDKPRAPENGCGVEDKLDFIIQLEDIVRRNDGKHVLIAAHHPMFSNGNHGGHYNLLDNIFPLRLVRDNLYIPLPVIGSLYPILRKSGASPQDIPSSDFQEYKRAVMSILSNRENVIYAAGHDHNLQLRREGLMHHVISGAGSKLNFAARGFGAEYVQQAEGFAKITYYKNGEAWIEFYTVDTQHPEGHVSFRTSLYALNPEETKSADEKEVPDYRDSVKVMAANENYSISGFGKTFFGKHYRNEWTTPVKIPYLDIKTYRGGLKPVKKGGGKQTISIRFINDDSVQFNLRSVDKFPSGAIPEIFRDTWVNDFAKDQISTAHPYGALTIPKMSDAIGIYYTTPELYYTPRTPYLGPYLKDFGGQMGLIEIRPDEDLSGYKRFGYSKNIVSSETMFEHMQEDNDNEVDSKLYLKSRFFDMLIGDWDRHEDQWRWAEYEKKDKGSIYRPVPRDRDQVYVLYDGVIPWLLSRKWAFRNFSNFDYDISDIKGLNFSARNLDHALLSELSQKDWLAIAQEIQDQLTDEIIDESIKELPAEVYPLSGPEIAAKIKSRRQKLMEYAKEYYKYLAKEVNIVGSEKHELYKITRMSDNETWAQVFKTDKEGNAEKKIYDRIFFTDETKEIRIFGRDGHDQFMVDGTVNRGIKIRIIGGPEKEDVYEDNSSVGGWGKKTVFYDNIENEGNMQPGTEAKMVTSKKEWVNAYDRNSFNYDYVGPRLFLEYNVDDGLYLGGGVNISKEGFRRDPLKVTHTILANYAIKTGAANFRYNGEFYSLFGHHLDLSVEAIASGPKYLFNYFGQGNETDINREIDYYKIRMHRIQVTPSLVRRFSSVFQAGLGPNFEYIDVEENRNTVLETIRDENLGDTQGARFAGFKFFTMLKLVDHPVNPEKGVIWRNEINYFDELQTGNTRFTNYNTDLSIYFTPNLPVKVTFASRVGAATNVGDFYFYHSNFLGNLENLRGYRRTRFAGKTSFYNNNEVRFKVVNLRNNLLNGNFGLFGFYDQGRVWSKNGSSSEMHRSFGPGVYLHFFEVFLFSGSYGISEEDKLVTFKAGFLF